jgi:hypothetical protein
MTMWREKAEDSYCAVSPTKNIVSIEIVMQPAQYTGPICNGPQWGDMSPEAAKLFSDLAPVGTLFISAMSAIGGAVWIVITYIRTQRDIAATKLFEAKKPFTELRLKL